MSEPIGGRTLRRSAKDLGRVLALAWLASREESNVWSELWAAALAERFPQDACALATVAGGGLQELIDNVGALEEAHHAATVGLLAGKGVSPDNLRAIGQQLIAIALKPLAQRFEQR